MSATAHHPVRTRPKQQRSRARRAALLEYGARLLNESDLDELSVAEITEGLGYSTGSFYSYFPDKAAFFVEVQNSVNQAQNATISETFETAGMMEKSLIARLATCVDFALGYFRAYTGLIRSALRYERRIPEAWAPNRATTQRIVAAASVGLNPSDREKLEIAVQLAFGMLVNALLHDPGPLRLHDPTMGPKIISALRPYLATDGQQ